MSKHSSVDADFLALPLEATSDAAIDTAQSLGASHVDVRIEKTRTGFMQRSNGYRVMKLILLRFLILKSWIALLH